MADSDKNRVLLLYPAAESEQLVLVPLSMLYVAAPLIEYGIEVEIVDQRLERDFFDSVRKRIGPDLICVGISCITGPQIEQTIRISQFVKKLTDAPIVLGGPHATLFPDQTLESEWIDYVVTGRGEAPFLNLVRALKTNATVHGIARVGYRSGGKTVVNNDRVDEIDVRKIPYALVLRYGVPMTVPVITSYGCRYRCSFCVERILHPKYQEIPIGDVSIMLADALRLGPKFINFIDDNFLLNKNRVIELFSLCRGKNLDFRWVCTGRVDNVLRLSDDELRFLKKSGLFAVYFGIESGSPRILELIRKGIAPEMVLELNLRLKKEGIIPHYSFMAGFPTETKEDFEKTIKIISRLKQENPNAVIWKINKYTPYPGTDLFDLAVQNGFKAPETLEGWGNVYFYAKEYATPYNASL
jgi:radical SAM superfamily enzyme YgiQ (UPF0313 family)